MMAQYLALNSRRETACCSTGWAISSSFFRRRENRRAVLDIALTSRGEHGGAPIPMCGVPVHSAESYLARLIKAGCRVAIAEQVETPEEAKKRGGSKALVARDIVRFVTAGTLTEEALLEPRRANVLAAVCEVRGLIGIAACDISTGRMELEECEPAAMGAALARLGASEIVASEDWADAPFDAVRRPGAGSTATRGEGGSRICTACPRSMASAVHPADAGGGERAGRLSRPCRARPPAAAAAPWRARRAGTWRWTRRRAPAWKSSCPPAARARAACSRRSTAA
jgi:hypothetical protein